MKTLIIAFVFLFSISISTFAYPDNVLLSKDLVKYKGDKLTLDFKDVEVRGVIETLADFTGLNIVTSDDVHGLITLKLHEVRWDEALDYILVTKNLEKYESGNITWIFPLGQVKEYQKQKADIAASLETSEPLITKFITINYAKADDFRNLLRGADSRVNSGCGVQLNNQAVPGQQSNQQGVSQLQAQPQPQLFTAQPVQGSVPITGTVLASPSNKDHFQLLSSRGSAVVDGRTNTLIVRETAQRMTEITDIINRLDVPVRQVMIESRVVIANKSFALALGTRFGVANTAQGANPTASPTIVNQAVSALAVLNPYGQLGMVLAKSASSVLNVEFTALHDSGTGDVVSNPRVMTSDRCLATIKQGYEVPYQSSSANTGTNTQFKEALLELDVLPQITPNGGVTMALTVSKDQVDISASINGQPSLIKRQLQTTVHVKDGETLILGGVFEGDKEKLNSDVPFFSDIPLIGFLFKRNSDSDSEKELLIFVTPKIINH